MTKAKEGARGFSVIVHEIDDGALHTELSETIQKLSGDLVRYAENVGGKAKGSMTLAISFEAKANGTVSVSAEVKVKQPKERRAGSTFFLTAGDNLSVANPRQMALPVRDVSRPETRDVPSDDRGSVSL